MEREQEFVALMELGGGSAERMAAAFRSKLPTIIARFDKAGSIKRLMGGLPAKVPATFVPFGCARALLSTFCVIASSINPFGIGCN